MMNNILWNDQLIKREPIVDIEDRGYQFGDGVYEVVAIYNGKLFLLDEHIERLERSAQEIQLSLPCSMVELKQNLIELVERNELEDGVVYLQISRGVAERWHAYPEKGTAPVLIAYTKKEETMTKEEEQGAKAILTPDIRWLRCDIKTLNLLPNAMAKQKAVEAGAVEAILHRDDKVTEASSSNVFIVKDNKVYTHPANNLILNGITRQKVIELCSQLNIPVQTEAYSVQDLLEAEEVFVTATKLDIVPIIEVDEHSIGDGVPGEITKKIVNAFRQLRDRS
jgi:D-alanine transaminase